MRNQTQKIIEVIRFMSIDEARLIAKGETVHNKTDHRKAGYNSDSVGFCFWVGNERHDSIYQAAMHLSGIVNMEVCLRGHVDLNKIENYRLSPAYYHDKESGGKKMVTELSMRDYTLRHFEDHEFFKPDPDAGPILYSGSWIAPIPMRKR